MRQTLVCFDISSHLCFSALSLSLSVTPPNKDADLSYHLTISVSCLLHFCLFVLFLKHALVTLFLTLTHPRSLGRLSTIKSGSGSRINAFAFSESCSEKVCSLGLRLWPAQRPGAADMVVGGDWRGHYLPCCCTPDFKVGSATAVTAALHSSDMVLTARAETRGCSMEGSVNAVGFIKRGSFNLSTVALSLFPSTCFSLHPVQTLSFFSIPSPFCSCNVNITYRSITGTPRC